MNQSQQARALIDGDLLEHIERQIRQDYFDEWSSARTVDEREAIHSKQAALEQVVYSIRDKAKGILKDVS